MAFLHMHAETSPCAQRGPEHLVEGIDYGMVVGHRCTQVGTYVSRWQCTVMKRSDTIIKVFF